MEIKIKTNNLTTMLKTISNITTLKKESDIFSYILIKKIKNKIFCIAINEEIEIVTTCEEKDKNEENIDLIIKYELLYNICKSTKNDSYIIFKKNNDLTDIITEKSIFKIPNLHNSDYPSFKKDNSKSIIIKTTSNEFKNLLKYHYAIINNIYNNKMLEDYILIEANKNSLNAVAYNGIQNAFSQILIQENIKKTKIILHKNIIKEFINLYKSNVQIFIKISENYLKIIDKETTITARLTNIIYDIPDKNVVDSVIITSILINTRDFRNAIAMLKSICQDNILVLDIKYDKIIIIIKNKSEYGETLLQAKIKGEEIKINLNYTDLRNILKIIESEELEIIITEKKTIIFKEEKNICIYTTKIFKK